MLSGPCWQCAVYDLFWFLRFAVVGWCFARLFMLLLVGNCVGLECLLCCCRSLRAGLDNWMGRLVVTLVDMMGFTCVCLLIVVWISVAFVFAVCSGRFVWRLRGAFRLGVVRYFRSLSCCGCGFRYVFILCAVRVVLVIL